MLFSGDIQNVGGLMKQVTADKPIFSGNVVAGEQVTRNKPLRSGEVVLEQIEFISPTLQNKDEIFYYDEKNELYYVANLNNVSNEDVTIKQYDSSFTLLGSITLLVDSIRFPLNYIIQDNQIFVHHINGMKVINIDINDFSNSSVSDLFSNTIFNLANGIVQIFKITDSEIHAYLSPIDNGIQKSYVKINKNTGSITDTILTTTDFSNSWGIMYFNNKMYHIWRNIPSVYEFRIMDWDNMQLTILDTSIPYAFGSIQNIISQNIWSVIWENDDKLILSNVDPNDSSIFNSIESKNSIEGLVTNKVTKLKNGYYKVFDRKIMVRTFKLSTI